MPGSVRDLKARLLEAIDKEGNVTNMEILCEVVTALEKIQLTAEDLHVTRLGKFVNLARRKAADKSLAKRLKNLVKRWQKLLQSCTSNGLPSAAASTANSDSSRTSSLPAPEAPLQTSTSVNQPCPVVAFLPVPPVQQSAPPPSTPSPPTSSSPAPSPAISSLSAQPTPTASSSTPLGGKNNAIFNRRQKLQMLSQLNKRPPVPVSSGPPHVVNELELDNGPLHTSKEITSEKEEAGCSLKGVSCVSGYPDGPSVVHEPLIVSIPHVDSSRRAFSKHLPTCVNGSAVSLSLSPDHTHNLVTLPEQSVNVKLISTSFIEHTLSLVVTIDTSRLPTPLTLCTAAATSGEETNSSARPKDSMCVPVGCMPGIDGHIGQDGHWYDWTKAMPPIDGVTVTALPYVYLDDVDV